MYHQTHQPRTNFSLSSQNTLSMLSSYKKIQKRVNYCTIERLKKFCFWCNSIAPVMDHAFSSFLYSGIITGLYCLLVSNPVVLFPHLSTCQPGLLLARGAELERTTSQRAALLSLNFISQRAVTVPFLHVFLQRAVDTERHVTDFTFVHVLAQLSVGLHVAGELRALGARVAAQLALVGTLSSVTAPVHSQVAAVLEHFAAILTSVTAAAVLGVRPAVAVPAVGSAGPAAGAATSRGSTFSIQLTWWGGETKAAVL